MRKIPRSQICQKSCFNKLSVLGRFKSFKSCVMFLGLLGGFLGMALMERFIMYHFSSLFFVCFPIENIFNKNSFLCFPICECHLTVAMLDSVTPVPFINRSIYPSHIPVSVSFIIYIFSCVFVTWKPSKHPGAPFLIQLVFSLVWSSYTIFWLIPFSPVPFSVLETIFPLSDIRGAVVPCVLAPTIWSTFFVFSCICVSIWEYICPFTFF